MGVVFREKGRQKKKQTDGGRGKQKLKRRGLYTEGITERETDRQR